MLLKLQNLLRYNASLKVSSVIIGIALWALLSESHQAYIQVRIPVCFYNVPEQYGIKGPEMVTVTLKGRISDLRHLNTEELAAHINAEHLAQGLNSIDMTSQHLLLPPTINLVKYKPIHILLAAMDN